MQLDDSLEENGAFMVQRSLYIFGSNVDLAEPVLADIMLIYGIWQDPLVQKNFNFIPDWQSYDEFLEWHDDPTRKKPRFYATILYRQDKQAIGAVSLAPEDQEPDLAIWLQQDFRRKGLGTEAFALAVQFLFQQLDIPYLLTGVYEYNLPSIRLMDRLQFKRFPQKDLVEDSVFGEGQVQQLAFRLLHDEWCEQHPTIGRRE